MKQERESWNSTKKAIMYLYSFMKGCAPLYFSEEGVMEFFDDEYFDKIFPSRNVQDWVYKNYTNLAKKQTAVLLKELENKNPKLNASNPEVQIVKRFFELQVSNYPKSQIHLINSKFVSLYNKEMYDFDKMLSVDGCVSVNSVAGMLEKKLGEAYYSYILREGGKKRKIVEDVSDLVCGTHRVYDSQTKKFYMVCCFAHDAELRNAFDFNNMHGVNRILLKRVEQNPSDYLILGEADGLMNPFSMLPVGFRNRTKVSNLNMFFETSENSYLKNALSSTLEEFETRIVSREGFGEAIEIANVVKKAHGLFMTSSKNVEALYDDDAMKAYAKDIYKIIKPKSAVEQVLHRNSDTHGDLCRYLKNVKQNNDNAILNESDGLEVALSICASRKRAK